MLSADAPAVLERFHGELELVELIAKRISRSIGALVEYDDLLAAGREGLLEAARRFEPERGIAFRAYAGYRVHGAIIDGIRKMAGLSRRAHERLAAMQAAGLVSEGELETAPSALQAPEDADVEAAFVDHLAALATATAMGAECVDYLQPAELGAADPEQALERAELLACARDGILTLPVAEADIIRRHYFEGERLEDIGRDLGMSKSWASRLHSRAIGRLTQRIRSVTQ